MDIKAAIAKVEDECPDTPFIGSDEWDLNDAFKDGWNAALDALTEALKES
jgi:hypothetical protein